MGWRLAGDSPSPDTLIPASASLLARSLRDALKTLNEREEILCSVLDTKAIRKHLVEILASVERLEGCDKKA